MALALSHHPVLAVDRISDAGPSKRHAACSSLDESTWAYDSSALAIPQELLYLVCSHMDAADPSALVAFGGTCKRFAALSVSLLQRELEIARRVPVLRLEVACAHRHKQAPRTQQRLRIPHVALLCSSR